MISPKGPRLPHDVNHFEKATSSDPAQFFCNLLSLNVSSAIIFGIQNGYCMTPFQENKSLLVLAPHLEYPVRSGADIAIDRKYSLFSRWLPDVTILAKDCMVVYIDGKRKSIEPFQNRGRSPSEAGIRTLLNRSHYHLEKFLTPAYRRKARNLLQEPRFGNVVFSYICTASLMQSVSPRVSCMVETHNDDFLWFEQLEHNTRNLLGKWVARQSLTWTKRFLTRHAHDLLYIHVTESDWKGYNAHIPGHPHLVIPIGVDMDYKLPDGGSIDPTAPILLFVGSLNVNMNYDALVHYRDHYFPELKNAFGQKLTTHVAGRTPSPAVIALCRENGWKLFADVSEEQLNELYSGATFAILPFAYATGAKLKLLKTLSRGVPFLATPQAFTQITSDLPHCLVSDEPGTWTSHIKKTLDTGIEIRDRSKLVDHAAMYSWDAVAKQVFTDLVSMRDTSSSEAERAQ